MENKKLNRMIQERKWMVVNRKSSLRCRDAADERQYMLSGDYEGL